jgi:hypothetical protein
VSTPSKEDTLTSKCNCILTTLEKLNKLQWLSSLTAEVLAMMLSSPESSLLSLPDTDVNVETAELSRTTPTEPKLVIKELTMPMFLTVAELPANSLNAVTALLTTKTAKNAILLPSTLLPDKPADPTADCHTAVMVSLMLAKNVTRESGGKDPAVLVLANLSAETPASNPENNATTELLELAKSMSPSTTTTPPKPLPEPLADSTASGLAAEITSLTTTRNAIREITTTPPLPEVLFCQIPADPIAPNQNAVTELLILFGVTSMPPEPHTEANNVSPLCHPNTANKTAHGTAVTEDSISTKLAITEL